MIGQADVTFCLEKILGHSCLLMFIDCKGLHMKFTETQIFASSHGHTTLLISATVSTIDWSLMSIHIRCASHCIAPSINPI